MSSPSLPLAAILDALAALPPWTASPVDVPAPDPPAVAGAVTWPGAPPRSAAARARSHALGADGAVPAFAAALDAALTQARATFPTTLPTTPSFLEFPRPVAAVRLLSTLSSECPCVASQVAAAAASLAADHFTRAPPAGTPAGALGRRVNTLLRTVGDAAAGALHALHLTLIGEGARLPPRVPACAPVTRPAAAAAGAALTAGPAALAALWGVDVADRRAAGAELGPRLGTLRWVAAFHARPLLAAVPDAPARLAAVLDWMRAAQPGGADGLTGGSGLHRVLEVVKELAVVHPACLRQSPTLLAAVTATYTAVGGRLPAGSALRLTVRERVRTILMMGAVGGGAGGLAASPPVLSWLVDDIAVEWALAAATTTRQGGGGGPMAQGRGHPLFIYLYLLGTFLTTAGPVPDRGAPMMVSVSRAKRMWASFRRVAPGSGPSRPDGPTGIRGFADGGDGSREWEVFAAPLLALPTATRVVVAGAAAPPMAAPGVPAAIPVPPGTVFLTCPDGRRVAMASADTFRQHLIWREVNWGCQTCGSTVAAGVSRVVPTGAPDPPAAASGGRRQPTRGNTSPCAACRIARYCSVDCQRLDWNGGHKADCRRWARLYAPADAAAAHLNAAVSTAGPWTGWTWPARLAADAEAAGVPLASMLVALDREAGSASLLPAAVYHRLRNAVAAAELQAPLAKHGGRVLRVVCAAAPPRVYAFGPRALRLEGDAPPREGGR